MRVPTATTLDYDYVDLTQASVGAYFSSPDTSTIPTLGPQWDLKAHGDHGVRDYQQDAMWAHDEDEEEDEIIRIEYEKKVPFIRRKDEVLNLQQNTLKMVVEPQKYTQGTMVRERGKYLIMDKGRAELLLITALFILV